jgi:hypothetical protein
MKKIRGNNKTELWEVGYGDKCVNCSDLSQNQHNETNFGTFVISYQRVSQLTECHHITF